MGSEMCIRDMIQPDQINILMVGLVVSFIVAMIAIKGFIGIVTRYGFRGFGYYRIVLGVVILALIYTGHNLQMN